MTQQMREAISRPWVGTALLTLYSALIAFVIFALGWQWQQHTEHKREMKEISSLQNARIDALNSRQDILRQRHEALIADNYNQDQRIAREYVTLERHGCDVKDLKEYMKEGFTRLARQIDEASRQKR